MKNFHLGGLTTFSGTSWGRESLPTPSPPISPSLGWVLKERIKQTPNSLFPSSQTTKILSGPLRVPHWESEFAWLTVSCNRWVGPDGVKARRQTGTKAADRQLPGVKVQLKNPLVRGGWRSCFFMLQVERNVARMSCRCRTAPTA